MAVTPFLSVVVPTTSPFSCRRRSVACTSSTFGLVPSHRFSSCSATYAFDSRKCRADSPLRGGGSVVVSCASSFTSNNARPSTRLFVSGLSFRTTEESLRKAFRNFGELTEVNLVMDRIANRSRGFAFLRFSTEDESKKAIEGMHGKAKDPGKQKYFLRVEVTQ